MSAIVSLENQDGFECLSPAAFIFFIVWPLLDYWPSADIIYITYSRSKHEIKRCRHTWKRVSKRYLGFYDKNLVSPVYRLSKCSYSWRRITFISEERRDLLHFHEIGGKTSCVKSHNALETNERYHALLITVFTIVRQDEPTISNKLASFTAVKTVNDTVEPSGLVLTSFVYKNVLKMPINASKLLDHLGWMKAITIARKEMSKRVVQERGGQKQRLNVLSFRDNEIGIDDEDLMFRREPVWKWGDHTLLQTNKLIAVSTYDYHLLSSIEKIKPYKESAPPEHTAVGDPSDVLPENFDHRHIIWFYYWNIYRYPNERTSATNPNYNELTWEHLWTQ